MVDNSNYATDQLLQVQGGLSAAKHPQSERANLLRNLCANNCTRVETGGASRRVYEKH